MKCPLCKQNGKPFHGNGFYTCGTCFGIYKNRTDYVNEQDEINRYKEHNNDVNDPRYQNFVSPITNFILAHFKPHHCGLDFGSGTAPVISKVLTDNQYRVQQFDPFFSNNTALLKDTYDYIVCCEVIEHFHNPVREFALLHSMLNPGGKLVCMTYLYDESIDFKGWNYKNDQTHVFIYRRKTIEYVAEHAGFSGVVINNRLIVLNA